jgi:GAF domain-containing protein
VLLRNGEATYASVGNGRVCSANENDPAILAMRTWHEPVDLHRFDTTLEGERAFPMMARGRLLGVLVCGEKRNGEAFAPDESEALATVAHGVGTAIDLLGTKHNDSLERIAHAQEQLVEEFRSLKAELEGRHRDANA